MSDGNAPGGDGEGNAKWPDLAGRIEGSPEGSLEGPQKGGAHILPIRVYFEDTDFSGLVYHANYLRWIERGRSDYLRLLGVHHNELFDGGEGKTRAAFVVRRMELDYLKPARIDEILEVKTRCAELGAAWLILDQQVLRGDLVLFKARVQVVLVSEFGKPLRLSDHMRAALGG